MGPGVSFFRDAFTLFELLRESFLLAFFFDNGCIDTVSFVRLRYRYRSKRGGRGGRRFIPCFLSRIMSSPSVCLLIKTLCSHFFFPIYSHFLYLYSTSASSSFMERDRRHSCPRRWRQRRLLRRW